VSKKTSAEIAIIGAGPAGAHLATRLAREGRDVVLFDPKGAWEKPCGGGVTGRALREFSFLLEDHDQPRTLINKITIVSPSKGRVTVKVERPFAVFSRSVLNGMLLDRAIEAGASYVKTSISDFKRAGDGWDLTDADGQPWRTDFLVGADGAASFSRRRLLGIFEKQDLALAFGYNVDQDDSENGNGHDEEEVMIVFRKDFTGYLWAFPRPGVMNFGVASKLGERTSDDLRRILLEFVQGYYKGRMPDPSRMKFFGAKIPTLDLATWAALKASGEGWALIGDAAGFADPITGEGIYYALKSAELLAAALVTGNGADSIGHYEDATREYEALWRREFGNELEQASYRVPQFYHGYFFGHLITDAMVWLARKHAGVRKVLVDSLMGEQSYVTLKRDLLLHAYKIF
jgi:geranylgeranyl reductase family protein